MGVTPSEVKNTVYNVYSNNTTFQILQYGDQIKEFGLFLQLIASIEEPKKHQHG